MIQKPRRSIKNKKRSIPTNNVSDQMMPLQLLRNADFSFEESHNCVNYSILNGKFSDSLKQVD